MDFCHAFGCIEMTSVGLFCPTHTKNPAAERKRFANAGNYRAGKPIVCVETGTTYQSYAHAAAETGANWHTIMLCCQTGRVCKKLGWHFRLQTTP